jgi:hypothetical protein
VARPAAGFEDEVGGRVKTLFSNYTKKNEQKK